MTQLRLMLASLLLVMGSTGSAQTQLLNDLARTLDAAAFDESLKSQTWNQGSLNNALIAAANAGKTENIRLVLEAGADLHYSYNTSNALFSAMTGGSLPAAKLLLELGIGIDFKSHRKGNPLHKAVETKGYLRPKFLRLLYAHGANLEGRNNVGQTPLHQAAISCSKNGVEILLDLGADPRARDDKGMTPGQRANRWGCSSLREFLLAQE